MAVEGLQSHCKAFLCFLDLSSFVHLFCQGAAGNYITAVVARDRLGAISAVYTPGPVIEASAGLKLKAKSFCQSISGVTAAVATEFLQDALSHGDSNFILNALGSISSLTLVANSSEVASVQDLSLQAQRWKNESENQIESNRIRLKRVKESKRKKGTGFVSGNLCRRSAMQLRSWSPLR